MKKQFYRVRQLADQRVGRAEKTDLLTEDLQHVEKAIDKIKHACSNTNKKLITCMQGIGDPDKKKKKLNQLQLGLTMLESAEVIGEGTLLSSVLSAAGEAQSALAGELASCETEIDNQVLAPLQKMLEVDGPNIVSTKKKLAKACLDMDASKTRWLNAIKLTHSAKTNVNEALAKAELLKDELEEATLLFQSLQDSLATDMFTFVAGEQSYAQTIVQLLESQMRYHEASLKILQQCVPKVKQQLESSICRPVFGCPLETHLKVTEREIAVVIEECVLFLLESGMDVEGLFRLAGSVSKVKKLKATFDAGVGGLEDFPFEVHVVTAVLKLYLRELPEPLLGFKLYDEWINATNIRDHDQKLNALWVVLQQLPEANKNNLRYLICFLSKLAENSEVNKMKSSNIAIVVGPNLLWNNLEGGITIQHTPNISQITELLIDNCSWFFPEGCNFVRQQIPDDKLEALNNRYNSDNDVSVASSNETKKHRKTSAPECQNQAAMQGYYNPLASQFDIDLEKIDLESNNDEKSTPAVIPHLNKSQSLCIVSNEDKGHRRLPSNGAAPRRPAPPVPTAPKKVPSEGPPKHKPPDIPVSPTMRNPLLKSDNLSKPTLSALADRRNLEDKMETLPID